MKSLIALAVATVTAVAILGADVADAKRLGGGRSLGTQRQSVAPAASTPAPSAVAPSGAASNPVMPASPATAAAARPGAAAAAPAGASRWLGPIAGIAAGLGLAALLSHFGLSETFASFLLIALLVVAAVVVVRMVLSRRSSPQAPPLRYSTAGGVSGAHSTSQRFQPANEITPPGSPVRIEPTWGASSSGVSSARRMPPGFEPAPFLEQAKLQFHRLQEANDNGDRDTLANVTTPAMYREIVKDLDERKSQVPTEIVALDAEVVDVTQEGMRYVASIRFQGQLREDGAHDTVPFTEIWNLEKPVNGSTGWLLAGIQQTEDAAP
ncbi:MAG TPA: Tim44-like domain-containing protein [Casimicrobiaceae bacterium]